MQLKNAFPIPILLILFILGYSEVQAQEVKIELGPKEIGTNEMYTITVSLENGKITDYDNFPEIPGFTKIGTSSSSSTNIYNGKRSSSHSIIQNYAPSGEGEYILKPFYMNINGEIYSSPGKTIKVIAKEQNNSNQNPFSYDPFEEFFGSNGQEEFIEVEDDAFFALTTDKDQVYVGEGINVVLAFYVAERNEAPLNFYDVGRQLSEILKKLKPANCWEENFNIDNINETRVVIDNKNYRQFKIYQASFFPLNSNVVEFPSLGLQMIKYRVSRRQQFFGQNKKEDFKTYYSRPKTVKVVELPPHPLKDMVSVGDYKLKEKISSFDLVTGQSFTYDFIISGEGNIANIDPPIVPARKNVEFYAPTPTSNIKKTQSKITGDKGFSYYGIPNEPGNYDLNEYFQWIYFNTKKQNYDTLQSAVNIKVVGDSKPEKFITSSDLGGFYDRIELEDNHLISRNTDDFLKMFINIFIISMLVLTAIFIFRK